MHTFYLKICTHTHRHTQYDLKKVFASSFAPIFDPFSRTFLLPATIHREVPCFHSKLFTIDLWLSGQREATGSSTCLPYSVSEDSVTLSSVLPHQEQKHGRISWYPTVPRQ